MNDFIFIIILIVLLILGYFLTGGFGKIMDRINAARKRPAKFRNRNRYDKFNNHKS